MRLRSLLVSLVCLCSLARPTCAQNPDWTTPEKPFKIVGNLFYVGSKDLAAYLVATPQGLILINSNLASSAPQIRRSVELLGFRFSDIKILLNSQAHNDHVASTAEIKKLTGATIMVMAPDVPVVESGGKKDYLFANDPSMHFPPFKVDRTLHDGERVSLGGTVLVAHLTAGHTKGCTTWTMQVTEDDKTYDVVILGGAGMNGGTKLIHNPEYPRIAQDFTATFRTLKSLPCDIFLGAHGLYFDMQAKIANMGEGKPNPFIDPAGYKAYVEDREKAYLAELAKQSQAKS